jgi:2-polyprenyl-3-methyl-5-hydroxy-6-metoxy-1,4-benzoquinol methylase
MPDYNFFDPNPYGPHMKVINLVGKNKKVLEIGCATGQVTRRLAENGCEVVGIELSEESARVAQRYCKSVIVADVTKINNLEYLKYFDFILFMDVLEHLESPLDILKKLKICLKDGGLVVVSVPNIANWVIRWNLLWGNFEYAPRGILDETHLRFFNEKSARKLLEDAGFEIIKSDIIPSLPLVKMRAKLMYIISRLRPNFFAVQFLLIGRINSSSIDLHDRKMDVFNQVRCVK